MPALALPTARSALLARRPYLLGPLRFPGILSAPLASPYTEGGAKGSLTLVQTDGQFSTSGGKLVIPAQATPVETDLYGQSPTGLARTAGRALLAKILKHETTSDWPLVGWWNVSAAPSTTWWTHAEGSLELNADAGIKTENALGAVTIGTYAASVEYDVALVLRSVGAFVSIKGGGFSDWTLLWVAATGATATLYPTLANYSGTGTLDDLRVAGLGGAWVSDYGIAIQRLAGARSAGDTFTHTADCLLDVTIATLPSAGSIVYAFREQDTSNYWSAQISSTGALSLVETVAGGDTGRTSDAAAVANGNRLVVIAAGTSLTPYVENVKKTAYASASNFATATAGRIKSLGTGGSTSDHVSWPRTVSLPAGV